MSIPQKNLKNQIPLGLTLDQTLKADVFSFQNIEWSPDGKMIAIVLINDIIKICNAENGSLIWKLEGKHKGSVDTIAWSPDSKLLASGSSDTTIGIWNIKTGNLKRRLKGHSKQITTLKWSPDGSTLVSSSFLSNTKIWNTNNFEEINNYENSFTLNSLLDWHPDGKICAVLENNCIGFIDFENQQIKATINDSPFIDKSNYLKFSTDKQHIALLSKDCNIVILNYTNGQYKELEGHSSEIIGISFSYDGRLLASQSEDGLIILWRCDIWQKTGGFYQDVKYNTSLKFHPQKPILATLDNANKIINLWKIDINILLNAALGFESVRYRNAKVILVGDGGVGKSGLGMVLAGETFKERKASHGRHVWSLGTKKYITEDGCEETREILLWDLAGQPEFRLIHQLSLDHTSVALVLFDGSNPNDTFKAVGFWNKALKQAKGSENLVKFLIASRTDVCRLTVTDDRFEEYALEKGFQGGFQTSAVTGKGIEELLEKIEKAIDWNKLPITISERLFKSMKDFIVNQKNNDQILKTVTEIREHFRIVNPEASFNDEEFLTAIKQVQSHDLIKKLSFGDYVLLQSELLDNYASAMAGAARSHPEGLGCLSEQKAREGNFDFGSVKRVKQDEDIVIIQSVIELFITKELAIFDEGQLIFPSQFNRELPDSPNFKGNTVIYKFEGAILNVYTTLVVRLYYSEAFKMESLWKNSATFFPYGIKEDYQKCGFKLKEIDDGIGELTVFFGGEVADATKILFLEYIHKHLSQRSLSNSVTRERIYHCPQCKNEVGDQKAVKFKLSQRILEIACLYCDFQIPLIDLIEENFGKNQTKIYEMDQTINQNLDNASKETILKGEFMTLVGKANQIPRLTPNDDNGIDGEIEFRNSKNQASGQKIYVQLKSGDSYLKKKKDGTSTFYIEDKRHIDYWLSHDSDVYLIIRDSDEKMYWMNITEYLKTFSDNPQQTIVFNREEFTVNSLLTIGQRKLEQGAKMLKPSCLNQEDNTGLSENHNSTQEKYSQLTLDNILPNL